MFDNILFDSDNATVDRGIFHEFVVALVPSELAAGRGSLVFHTEEQ